MGWGFKMKSLIKNKRGEGSFLSEETVKLIISVASISILLILAGSLFYMFINSSELRKAEATLDEIVQVIERLEDGQTGRVLITGPRNWYLLRFESKLCICEEYVEAPCDDAESGVCRNVEDFSFSPTYVEHKYIDGMAISDITEVLIFDYEEERIILKGDYNDFIFARKFLDKVYSFYSGKQRMRDHILDYIKSRELDCVPFSWNGFSFDGGCEIVDVDEQGEALIKAFSDRYFSDSDIKFMGAALYAEEMNSYFIGSDVNLVKNSFVLKIGEVPEGDVYVRFSK